MLAMPPRLNTWRHSLGAAANDLVGGVQSWRIWSMLAANDVRQRYRRSALGQLWLTVSMGITIGAIGIVYSVLFNQEPATYLPFLGVGMVCWALIAGLVTEGCTAFIQSEGFIRQARQPRSLFIMRVLLRNLIIFAHNLLIVGAVVIIFAVPVGWATLLIVPGLLLTLATALWVGLLLGTACARFRDLPQVVASFMQVVFFVTPVIYKPETLGNRLWAVTHLNPFASFTAVLRDPLLGRVPAGRDYAMTILVTIVGFAITFPLFARFRARIVYWM